MLRNRKTPVITKSNQTQATLQALERIRIVVMAIATKNGTNEAHDKQKKPETGRVKSCDNKKTWMRVTMTT